MGWEQREGWRRPRRFFICRSNRGPVDKPDKSTVCQLLSGEWKTGRRQRRHGDMLGWTRCGKRNQSAFCF